MKNQIDLGRFARLFGLVLFFGLFAVSGGSAWSDSGGGEVPVPAGSRFELANGERYELVGKIIVSNSQPFFEVDFEKQPWLKNVSRVSNPRYPILSKRTDWKELKDAHVKFEAEAVAQVVVLTAKRGEYKISLKPVAGSTLYVLDEEGDFSERLRF